MVAVTSETLADPVRMLAYAGLAVACFAGAVTAEHRHARALRAVGVIALVLGIAVTLDLGASLADLGRRLAGSEGWYRERRPMQAAAILAILGFGLVAAIVTWLLAGRMVAALRIHLLLLLSLCCYVAVRAISLHQVDTYLNWRPRNSGIRLGDIIELSLITVLATSVLLSRVPQCSASRPAEK